MSKDHMTKDHIMAAPDPPQGLTWMLDAVDRYMKAVEDATGIPWDQAAGPRLESKELEAAQPQKGDLAAEQPCTRGYLCRHCGMSIRRHNGVWVHDDPDEDPKSEDYGWAKCLPKPNVSIECAEPDPYRLIFDLEVEVQRKNVRIEELEARLGIGQGEITCQKTT